MLGGVIILLSTVPAIFARLLTAFWYLFEAALWLTLGVAQSVLHAVGDLTGGLVHAFGRRPPSSDTALWLKKRA